MGREREIVAMILAGGQGSRLGVLTERIAKPAIPYGGRYRLIDFPLSNCVNSGIDTVGVVTQYKPETLYNHIGDGEAWKLNKEKDGVSFLPPCTEYDKNNYYRGTADAIYQNLCYIEQFNPEYVLILSGDHIYKMNYDEMLACHKAKKADATISVIEVPIEEASRFGIMNTNENLEIESFEEKPENPKSNTASMGVYIFNWAVLKRYLIEDSTLDLSNHDFGKNIIPQMLEDKRRLYAYNFKGYWRDVGTVESLWEANMDILNPNCELDLFNSTWRISSPSVKGKSSCEVGLKANIKNSIIGENCKINGVVKNSVLSSGVEVGEGAIIKNSVILAKTIIEPYAVIENAIIGGKTIVRKSVIVSGEKEIVAVGRRKDVSEFGITEKSIV